VQVFDFNDYKAFLGAVLEENRKRRGYQGKLAAASGCKTSYLSLVARGHVHFTPDHAAAACSFWGFSELESDYFMTLVHLARAGTPLLKEQLEKQLSKLRRRWQKLDQRITGERSELTLEQSIRYYSHWSFPALHTSLGVPELRTTEALARKFSIPEGEIRSILHELAGMGLIESRGNGWIKRSTNLHLAGDSPLARLGPTLWREQMCARRARSSEKELTYTGFHSVSRKDFERIRQHLIETIREIRHWIETSPDEDVLFLSLDLTPLGSEF
jgi:uncharacterized protein (TIGR02147 family)